MDVKMNQIAKLDVIPSGRRIREIPPDGEHHDQLDWKVDGDANKLMVAKINELIDAVSELQRALDGLQGASVLDETASVPDPTR
jgi:hypothetical protein